MASSFDLLHLSFLMARPLREPGDTMRVHAYLLRGRIHFLYIILFGYNHN